MEHILEFRNRDELLTRVIYDDELCIVLSVENNQKFPRYLWLMPEDEDYDFLTMVLSERIMPEERYIRDPEAQRLCGCIDYDPFKICKFTHGASVSDFRWIWFDTDPADLKYDDVKFRPD